jgi:hypothetical protein
MQTNTICAGSGFSAREWLDSGHRSDRTNTASALSEPQWVGEQGRWAGFGYRGESLPIAFKDRLKPLSEHAAARLRLTRS